MGCRENIQARMDAEELFELASTSDRCVKVLRDLCLEAMPLDPPKPVAVVPMTSGDTSETNGFNRKWKLQIQRNENGIA